MQSAGSFNGTALFICLIIRLGSIKFAKVVGKSLLHIIHFDISLLKLIFHLTGRNLRFSNIAENRKEKFITYNTF